MLLFIDLRVSWSFVATVVRRLDGDDGGCIFRTSRRKILGATDHWFDGSPQQYQQFHEGIFYEAHVSNRKRLLVHL